MLNRLIIDDSYVQVYDNEIEECIRAICEEEGIEDLKKERQRIWKYVLIKVGQRLFPKEARVLKQKSNIYNNGPCSSTLDAYNYNLINSLCDYYIELSNRYNKLISLEAFSYLTNIDLMVLDKWKEYNSNDPRCVIFQKIRNNREECLKDDCFDNGNVTGTISVGNTEYNWNMPGVRTVGSSSNQLSLSDLKRTLSLQGTQNKAIAIPDNTQNS